MRLFISIFTAHNLLYQNQNCSLKVRWRAQTIPFLLFHSVSLCLYILEVYKDPQSNKAQSSRGSQVWAKGLPTLVWKWLARFCLVVLWLSNRRGGNKTNSKKESLFLKLKEKKKTLQAAKSYPQKTHFPMISRTTEQSALPPPLSLWWGGIM